MYPFKRAFRLLNRMTALQKIHYLCSTEMTVSETAISGIKNKRNWYEVF